MKKGGGDLLPNTRQVYTKATYTNATTVVNTFVVEGNTRDHTQSMDILL